MDTGVTSKAVVVISITPCLAPGLHGHRTCGQGCDHRCTRCAQSPVVGPPNTKSR